MTRLTRAALRAQEELSNPAPVIHLDGDSLRSTPESKLADNLRSSRSIIRPILAEVAGNDISAPVDMPAKKGKGRKRTTRSKTNINLSIEDDGASKTLVEVAAGDNRRDCGSSTDALADGPKEEKGHLQRKSQVPTETKVPQSMTSVAKQDAGKSLSQSLPMILSTARTTTQPPATPKSDPIVHKDTVDEKTNAELPDEHEADSFVGSIKTRTPSQAGQSQEWKVDGPDSFVEDIITRSTPKGGARIEDSIEAMDAQEDAMEQITQSLPKLDKGDLGLPFKTRKCPDQDRRIPPTQNTLITTTVPTKPQPTDAKTSPHLTKTSITGRPTPTKAMTVPYSAGDSARARLSPVTRTTPGNDARPTSTRSTILSSSAPTKPSIQPVANAEKRTTSSTLSTSRPGFVPRKSTKPPTKSSFVLPGDAIAAKLKAQREERLGKEENAEQNKKVFKARPAPANMTEKPKSGLPRETATSRARASLISGAPEIRQYNDAKRRSVGPNLGSKRLVVENVSGQENIAPIRRNAVLRVSSYGVAAKEPSQKPSGARKASDKCGSKPGSLRASSSVRRTTATGPIAAAPQPVGISDPVARPAVVKRDIIHQRIRAKEIFGREKVEREQRVKEQKEKEGAAKRARAEAAARGREESRKWADKRKEKLRGVSASVAEDTHGGVEAPVSAMSAPTTTEGVL